MCQTPPYNFKWREYKLSLLFSGTLPLLYTFIYILGKMLIYVIFFSAGIITLFIYSNAFVILI